VTGGHGFIGRHVVAALAGAGATPIAVSLHETASESILPGESITLDLEHGDDLAASMQGIDYVVHLAARAGGIQFQLGGGEEIFASNRRITENLLIASLSSDVKRVFLASSLVTYRSALEPLTESHPQLGPADCPDPYAWSKITDEVAASWHDGLETVVGRFGNVYGPGAPFEPDRSTVVHALIDRAARLSDGEELVVWGDGTAMRSFVYVEDAARAVMTTLTKGRAGEAFNIDSGVETTIAQLATMVRDAVNPSLGLVFDPTKPAGRPIGSRLSPSWATWGSHLESIWRKVCAVRLIGIGRLRQLGRELNTSQISAARRSCPLIHSTARTTASSFAASNPRAASAIAVGSSGRSVVVSAHSFVSSANTPETRDMRQGTPAR
jgi:nucleoside-diphosphate-sugar epimerase